MLYCVNKRFVEGHEKIGLFCLYDPEFFNPLHQVVQNNVHQRKSAWQFKLNAFMEVLDSPLFIDIPDLVIKNGRDQRLQLLFVKLVATKIDSTNFEGFYSFSR